MPKPQMRIEGLDAFRRELTAIDPKFARAMGQVNKKAVERVENAVVAKYRGRYRSMSPRTRAGIKSLAQARAGKLRIGGASTPYLLGQTMGSVRYRQFPSPPAFLWPTIADEMPRVREDYLDALDAAVRQAFPRA